MGMPIPGDNKSDITMQQQRAATLRLMDERDRIEAQIEHQLSVLRMNDSTMQTPLVDSEGFPRADIDIVSVRTARVRVIELRNDLKAIMDQIALALQGIYPPEPEKSPTAVDAASRELSSGASDDTPFAMVDGVAPRSPAAQAGLQRGDLVVQFGTISKTSVGEPVSLTPLSQFVATKENQTIELRVKRPSSTGEGTSQETLTLTPRSGWGGRGLLGCHIVPYTGV